MTALKAAILDVEKAIARKDAASRRIILAVEKYEAIKARRIAMQAASIRAKS